jgi:hypothetical protein
LCQHNTLVVIVLVKNLSDELLRESRSGRRHVVANSPVKPNHFARALVRSEFNLFREHFVELLRFSNYITLTAILYGIC